MRNVGLKEVRIHPKYDCQFFEVEFITEEEPQIVEFKTNNAMAIDIGLNNLATTSPLRISDLNVSLS